MGAVPQPRVWFSLQGHVNDTKAIMTHDPEPDMGGEPKAWEQDEEWSSKKGYYQVPVNQRDIKKTAVIYYSFWFI